MLAKPKCREANIKKTLGSVGMFREAVGRVALFIRSR
jgi:hypothetical protein